MDKSTEHKLTTLLEALADAPGGTATPMATTLMIHGLLNFIEDQIYEGREEGREEGYEEGYNDARDHSV